MFEKSKRFGLAGRTGNMILDCCNCNANKSHLYKIPQNRICIGQGKRFREFLRIVLDHRGLEVFICLDSLL